MFLYKQVPAERLSGLNRFFDHEPLARRSQLYEPSARRSQLNEFLAFLAKAPSGWFPKSRQGSPNS